MQGENLRERLLLKLAERTERAQKRPRPDGRQNPTDCMHWEQEREYGPIYNSNWLPDVNATDAGRQRILRTIHKLHAEGLLVTVTGSEGGRLTNLQLTPEGWAVAKLLATRVRA